MTEWYCICLAHSNLGDTGHDKLCGKVCARQVNLLDFCLSNLQCCTFSYFKYWWSIKQTFELINTPGIHSKSFWFNKATCGSSYNCTVVLFAVSKVLTGQLFPLFYGWIHMWFEIMTKTKGITDTVLGYNIHLCTKQDGSILNQIKSNILDFFHRFSTINLKAPSFPLKWSSLL